MGSTDRFEIIIRVRDVRVWNQIRTTLAVLWNLHPDDATVRNLMYIKISRNGRSPSCNWIYKGNKKKNNKCHNTHSSIVILYFICIYLYICIIVYMYIYFYYYYTGRVDRTTKVLLQNCIMLRLRRYYTWPNTTVNKYMYTSLYKWK